MTITLDLVSVKVVQGLQVVNLCMSWSEWTKSQIVSIDYESIGLQERPLFIVYPIRWQWFLKRLQCLALTWTFSNWEIHRARSRLTTLTSWAPCRSAPVAPNLWYADLHFLFKKTNNPNDLISLAIVRIQWVKTLSLTFEKKNTQSLCN